VAELNDPNDQAAFTELLGLLAAAESDDEASETPQAGEMLLEDAFFDGIDLEGETEDPRPLEHSFDASDFDDPRLQFIFEKTKLHIRDACKVNTKPGPRARALRWVFVPNAPDENGLTFELCCTALGARATVLRARAQHQLWKAGVVITAPLDPEAVPLPSTFASEIRTLIGVAACVDLANLCWDWPGISGVLLREQARRLFDMDEQQYRLALKELMANGYVAATSTCLYFVARNPDLLPPAQLRRFSFARSIHGDS
jgi:hypothetical protein